MRLSSWSAESVGRALASRRRRALSREGLVGLLCCVAVLFGSQGMALATPPSSAITYGYDDLGRLIEASEPASNTATYRWDAAGNLTSILQEPSSAISVLQVAPNSAAVGATIHVYGTAFSSTLSQDSVTFNGIAASISSATVTELVVMVPSGASSGTISVSSPAGSANSPSAFTVVASRTPTITNVNTSLASPGSALTVSGTNFEANIANDMLGVNPTFAAVSSATTTTLSSTVPSSAGSGHVRVATPYGEATGPDLFIPPSPYTPFNVLSTARMSIGASQTVSINSAGKDAMVIFDGQAGQRVFLEMTSVTFNSVAVALYDTHNQTLGTTHNIGTGGGYIDTTTLPSTGTYTIFLAASSTSTGSMSLQLDNVPADFSASVTPSTSGASQAVATTVPGQNAKVTFHGTPGERIFVNSSGSTYGLNLYASIQNPDGTNLVSPQFLYGTPYIDTLTLSSTGTYTIFLDPQVNVIGSITLVVYEVPADFSASVTPSTSGASQAVATTVPGQNAKVTFHGTPGERIFVNSSGSTYGNNLNASIQNPDGTNLVSPKMLYSNVPFIDAVMLPATGTYTIFLDPQKDVTGSITLTVYEVPADFLASVTPSASGTSQTVTTTVPGQNGSITFQGNEGQRISVDSSAWNYGSGCCNVQVSLKKPDGTNLVNPTYLYSSAPFIDTVTLPATGTYTVFVDPQKDATGSIMVTTYSVPLDFLGTISIGGSPVTLSTTTPGQNAALTFSGSANKGIKLTASAVTIGTSACCSTKVSIRKPDGTNLVSPTYIGISGGTISSTLTVAGTYMIFVDPQSDATGKMTLTLVDPPVGALLSTQQSALPFSDANMNLGGPDPSAVDGLRGAPKRHRTPAGSKRPRRAIGHASAPARRASSERPRVAARTTETPLWTALQPAAWKPDASNRNGDWTTHLPVSPLASLPVLQAPDETTALAGQALKLNGTALASVTMSIEDTSVWTRTDKTGRFVLAGIPAGHHVLLVEGATAGTLGERYGHFEIGVDIQKSITNMLGYTIWMPELDRAHALNIASPTTSDTMLSTPHIPGLEVRIPKGSVITGSDGKPVRQLSITPVPVDRPPFPLPLGVSVPLYFTVQPGGAYLSKGAQIVYPNYTHLPPSQRVSFWNYDPDNRGWYVYGHGTVTRDAKQVMPDPGVRIWEFTGAMISSLPEPPLWWDPFCLIFGCKKGDPVDMDSGLFVWQKTDLALPDALPIALTRTYRPADSNSYSFGIGTTNDYDIRLWSNENYVTADLILPDSSRIHYVRTSPGTGLSGAAYAATETPTAFYGSTIVYKNLGWDLTLRNGLVYHFGDLKPLLWIRDRFGNQVTITRDSSDNITQVTSPNGRWIKFTHDSSKRITQATDNTGRTVSYTYDSAGRLATVTDANGGVTTYSYDSKNEMTSIKNARGITYLTNQYDENGRVIQQQLADGSIYKFSYTVEPTSGMVTQSTATDPNGNVQQASFNSGSLPTSVTGAAGTSIAQTTSYQWQSGTKFLTAITDTLGRTTSYGYDPRGNVASITQMAGTSDARTTSFTHGNTYSELTSVTDPLGHATSYGYDGLGQLTTITDPLNHTTTLTDYSGRPTSIADPLGNKRTYIYRFGDLVDEEDPLGNKASRFIDASGRMLSQTDPVGNIAHYSYDAFNDLTSVTDPDGGQTSFAYDQDSNLVSIIDARNNKSTGTYDNMDRLASDTDALGKSEFFSYDGNGNLAAWTDRKGQSRSYAYDGLNRPVFAGFAESTIGYTWDAANRLTQASDSTGGTFNETWDTFDELTGESGPNGSIAYSYDAAGRTINSTVAGQPQVSYSYDNANRLTAIEGSQNVAFAYDIANRLTSTTLPDGISENYSYDPASEPTAITYAQGSTTLGVLNYAYNPDGQKTAMWGSYARTSLPQPLSSASYNPDNELTSLAGQTYSYDADGNLTSDGTNGYSYNARGQLSTINGSSTTASFNYDPWGRREQSTINGASTSYLYDGQNVVQELSGGTPKTNYLLGGDLDQRYSRSDSNGTQSLLTDAIGSTIALADSEGNIKTTYTYDPFGSASSTGAASTNPYQYTGRENDGTGLQYSRARYYSPSTARFISQDPLGITGSGPDLYTYAANDPIDKTDPTGRETATVNGGVGPFYGSVGGNSNGETVVGGGFCVGDCASVSATAEEGSDPEGPNGNVQGCALGQCEGCTIGGGCKGGTTTDPGFSFGGGFSIPSYNLLGRVKEALSSVPSPPPPPPPALAPLPGRRHHHRHGEPHGLECEQVGEIGPVGLDKCN